MATPSFQVAVNPDTYRELVANLPMGWTLVGPPMLGPDGQMLVQVHDLNAPAHLHGKRITVTVRNEPDGSLTVTDYTLLSEPWQGNRRPEEQAATLDRYDEVRDEFGDPLQVVAASLARAVAAGTYAAEERNELRARVGQLEELARDVLRSFRERGHPGVACVRTGWVREERLRDWHDVLEGR